MYTVMIIEDESVIARMMKKHLSQWGFEVHQVRDFETVMDQFREAKPHLALIDVTLPFFNGYHWCTEIRKISDIPIIFISSAGEDLNILMAMQLGADDYLVKPFAMEVLMAKIQAVLRRSYEAPASVSVLSMGELILFVDEMAVGYREHRMELSKNEFKILEALMRQQGKVVHRDRLMEKLWQSDMYVDDNTLTVNVGRLRKRLGELGLEDIVKTKKGVGYYVEKEA